MIKKLSIAAVCSVLCCLCVTLWIVPMAKEARAAEMQTSSVASSEIGQTSSGKVSYRLSVYQGFVAAFDTQSDTPFLVLDTPITSLPTADQRLLREGIHVQTTEELQQLLEDYS